MKTPAMLRRPSASTSNGRISAASSHRAMGGGGPSGAQTPGMSAATQQLLHSMLGRSGMSKRRQQEILRHVTESNGTLPAALNARRAAPASAAVPPIRVAYRMEPGPFRPGLRLQDEIVKQCDNYAVEKFRPTATKDRTKEIERLQRVMSQDAADDVAKMKKKRAPAPADAEPIDPVAELLAEIEERRDWLTRMEALGKADEYRMQIQTEINIRVRQMEQWTARLNREELGGGEGAGAGRLPPL
ncbi:hypothetical protein H9P43_000182 [Blastocladiella emersonii ATCC 22665]|nr:hypothetical protein H9P43_000182 [Blastocladiella emersonii ATCC 22665]